LNSVEVRFSIIICQASDPIRQLPIRQLRRADRERWPVGRWARRPRALGRKDVRLNPDPITARLAADRSLVCGARGRDSRRRAAVLVEGGIQVAELTFTSPDLLSSLQRAAAASAAILGADTGLTADDA